MRTTLETGKLANDTEDSSTLEAHLSQWRGPNYSVPYPLVIRSVQRYYVGNIYSLFFRWFERGDYEGTTQVRRDHCSTSGAVSYWATSTLIIASPVLVECSRSLREQRQK